MVNFQMGWNEEDNPIKGAYDDEDWILFYAVCSRAVNRLLLILDRWSTTSVLVLLVLLVQCYTLKSACAWLGKQELQQHSPYTATSHDDDDGASASGASTSSPPALWSDALTYSLLHPRRGLCRRREWEQYRFRAFRIQSFDGNRVLPKTPNQASSQSSAAPVDA